MAQLGARFHGMEEVIGSIPIRSTKSFSIEYLSALKFVPSQVVYPHVPRKLQELPPQRRHFGLLFLSLVFSSSP